MHETHNPPFSFVLSSRRSPFITIFISLFPDCSFSPNPIFHCSQISKSIRRTKNLSPLPFLPLSPPYPSLFLLFIYCPPPPPPPPFPSLARAHLASLPALPPPSHFISSRPCTCPSSSPSSPGSCGSLQHWGNEYGEDGEGGGGGGKSST